MYPRHASTTHRRSTPAGPATMRTHNLGAHPIVQHFLERMNVVDIVRSCVGGTRLSEIDHGQAIGVLVHNMVQSPGPLYRVGEWAAPLEAHVLGLTPGQRASVNDDRIGRALDALASERGRSIFFRLALRTIKQFGIDTARIHHDTTTVTLTGRYSGSRVSPFITFGNNKDYRPDLKQLVFGLNVSADGAVPISHQVHSGNRTDDSIHLGNTEELRRILGRDDFVYVADCKLATTQNLRAIHAYGGRFVTVLPRSRKEDMRFRSSLRMREKPPRWKVILRVPNGRRESEPPDLYSSCAGPSRTDDGFRLIWIRSAQKAIQDAQVRKENLRQAELSLGQLSAGLNRRHLKKRRAVRDKVNAILRKYKVEAWLQVTLHEYDEVSTRYLGSGRPRPDAPVRKIRTRKLRLQVKRDDEALRREAHTDGVFPLITDLERTSKKDVLLIYKYQPYVEKRFAQIKTEHEIAPVYLKKPQRVAGLLHAYFIALSVSALIERQVRKGMLLQGIEELPLLPEGRTTPTPTAARILEAFTSVSWYEFERADETVAFPIKLSALQIKLLDLLEVPRSVYA